MASCLSHAPSPVFSLDLYSSDNIYNSEFNEFFMVFLSIYVVFVFVGIFKFLFFLFFCSTGV
jgi:hypothetical protein